MIPCLSQATTLATPFETDVATCAEAGWPAIELWLTKLEKFLEDHPESEARTRLDDAGVRPLAASLQGGLLVGTRTERSAHWEHFRRRLATLQALAVPLLVVVPDFRAEPHADEIAEAGARLAEAADLAAKHGVRLALEFQRGQRFCASLDSAAAFLAHSGAAAGLCFDVFHYYCGPSKFEDLAYLTTDNLAHVHLSDLSGTPRELATDADRILPGDGDFQLDPILDHFIRIGYCGPVSLEVLSPLFWEMPSDRVAQIGLSALHRTLGDRSVSPSVTSAGRS